MSAPVKPRSTGTGQPGIVMSGGRRSGEFPADAEPFADAESPEPAATEGIN